MSTRSLNFFDLMPFLALVIMCASIVWVGGNLRIVGDPYTIKTLAATFGTLALVPTAIVLGIYIGLTKRISVTQIAWLTLVVSGAVLSVVCFTLAMFWIEVYPFFIQRMTEVFT